MKVSKRGLDLIKKFESLQLKAYYCPAGILSIGYGTTQSKKIKIVPGLEITEKIAEDLLLEHVKIIENELNELINVKLTQNQFDSLVSFVYNVGIGNFQISTLLRLLNKGDFIGASNQFTRWVRAKNKILPGLVYRREMEKSIFLLD